jgi:bleomycin hydrolase
MQKIVFFITLISVYFSFAQDKAFYETKFVWDKDKKIFSANFSTVEKPAFNDFKTFEHFTPVRQDTTGTCWSYSALSFLESEVYRIHKKKIKLSEMYVAYWEYVEKARRYIQEKGNSEFGEGSQGELALARIKQYGIVPLKAYTGLINGAEKHNHDPMYKEMYNYLKFLKKNNYWDEEVALANIKNIMNKHIGVPPISFKYKGKTYTPEQFRDKAVNLNMDDYKGFLSTMQFDFYKKCEFNVPDNWNHSEDYYNIPLDVFYKAIKTAIQNGYTLMIGGDVSEAGKYGWEDIAIVVPWDIAPENINQFSREFRINNKTTGDDHGIHLVGYAEHKGRDWFLIKDSGSSSHYGKHKGYYYFSGDFIKLKMLGFLVHKNAVKEILNLF